MSPTVWQVPARPLRSALLVLMPILLISCDSSIRSGQDIANQFFKELNRPGGNSMAYQEHFAFDAKISESGASLCGPDDYASFHNKWLKLKITRVDVGAVQPLDQMGLDNEVEVVAYADSDHATLAYSALFKINAQVNYVPGPRGWVAVLTAYPSLLSPTAKNLGNALCQGD